MGLEDDLKLVREVHGVKAEDNLIILMGAIRYAPNAIERTNAAAPIKNWLLDEQAKGRRYPEIHEYVQRYEHGVFKDWFKNGGD